MLFIYLKAFKSLFLAKLIHELSVLFFRRINTYIIVKKDTQIHRES